MSQFIDEMRQGGFIKDLEGLGLDSKQARVFLSLLHLGEVGSSKIIEDTGLHGQFVYQALGELEARGLAKHVIKRGRKKFSAQSPHKLVALMDRQKSLASNLATELEQVITIPALSTFETYQGEEAYVAHELDILGQAPMGSELLIIGGKGDHFNDIMGGSLPDYVSLQLGRKVKIRYIGSEAERKDIPEMHGGRRDFEIRYLPGLFAGEVNTNIWPFAIGFNIYSSPVTRFTIMSEVVAKSYTQFFEALWKLAKM